MINLIGTPEAGEIMFPRLHAYNYTSLCFVSKAISAKLATINNTIMDFKGRAN